MSASMVIIRSSKGDATDSTGNCNVPVLPEIAILHETQSFDFNPVCPTTPPCFQGLHLHSALALLSRIGEVFLEVEAEQRVAVK